MDQFDFQQEKEIAVTRRPWPWVLRSTLGDDFKIGGFYVGHHGVDNNAVKSQIPKLEEFQEHAQPKATTSLCWRHCVIWPIPQSPNMNGI